MSCPSCLRQLSHCHGLLVVHADGTLECSEETACPGSELVLHDFSSDCDAAGTACHCLGVPVLAG